MSSGDKTPNKDFQNKRKRTDSSGSAENPLALLVCASPPRFVSLEELLSTATSLDKMALAHEIAINSDFKFEPTQLAEGSLAKRVSTIMHQAFWDLVREEMSETPPQYEHSLVLIAEIKETLQSLLLPGHTKMKAEFDEHLDMDLIRQQCEKGCCDFRALGHYVLSVMKKMCAPIRDQPIDELNTRMDVVDMFRGIFETLDLMKLDMANYTISTMRPTIQQHSVEYERETFAKFLETNPNGLEITEKWLRRAYEILEKQYEERRNKKAETSRLAASSLPPMPDSEESEQHISAPSISSAPVAAKNKPSASEILSMAYWTLLEKAEYFPETFVVDQDRISELCRVCQRLIIVSAAVAVTCNTAGQDIADLREFKDQLKDKLWIVLADSDTQEQLSERLSCAAELIDDEIHQILQKIDLPEWDGNRRELLKSQIKELANADQPVRKLMRGRIQAFVIDVVSHPTASPIKIPTGLNIIQKDLARLTGNFLRLVSHNRAVFAPYYDSMLEKISASAV